VVPLIVASLTLDRWGSLWLHSPPCSVVWETSLVARSTLGLSANHLANKKLARRAPRVSPTATSDATGETCSPLWGLDTIALSVPILTFAQSVKPHRFILRNIPFSSFDNLSIHRLSTMESLAMAASSRPSQAFVSSAVHAQITIFVKLVRPRTCTRLTIQ